MWGFVDGEPPTMVKQSHAIKNKMIAVCFSGRGIIKWVILDTQAKVTASWYTQFWSHKVIEKLKKFRSHTRLNTWWLYNNNAPALQAYLTQEFSEDFGLPLPDQPHYSLDLAPFVTLINKNDLCMSSLNATYYFRSTFQCRTRILLLFVVFTPSLIDIQDIFTFFK